MTADVISAVQDDIIGHLSRGFAVADRSLLKTVAGIEVPFDAAATAKLRMDPPAIYVTPLMIRQGNGQFAVDISWAIYCVAASATPKASAKGSTGAFGIGSYAIAARAMGLLQHFNPETPCAGSLMLAGAENLTGIGLIAKGFNCWAVTVVGSVDLSAIEDMPLHPAADANITPFETFHADIDLPPFQDPPETLPAAHDAALTVELPQ